MNNTILQRFYNFPVKLYENYVEQNEIFRKNFDEILVLLLRAEKFAIQFPFCGSYE